SYLTLSRKLNHEKAIRAVASANGANALSILIPCHRVIASNGELTGYAGGLTVKKKLLQIEGALNRGQLNLF
ncbi:methylated-DNA--[protein]-cysteine S-methyltransferase, partial [Nonlabens ulvanivorans]